MNTIEKKASLFFLFLGLFFCTCLALIYFFRSHFEQVHSVVKYHRTVLFFLFGSTIILSLLIRAFCNILNTKFSSYFIALPWAVLMLILYLTYALSFVGEAVNARIFTLRVSASYIPYTLNYINSGLIKPIEAIIAYSIPVLLISFVFLNNKIIEVGINELWSFLRKHNFNNPPLFYRISIVLFCIILGYTIQSISEPQKLLAKYQNANEPFSVVFFKMAYQRQFNSNDTDDLTERIRYPKGQKFNHKNVIIITVDALRADHIGPYGYFRETTPFLDSLYNAGRIKKVNRAYSVAPASFAGILGILRSKVWSNIGYSNFSIQDLLKDQGYKINFILSGDHTNFYDLRSFYGKNVDYYKDASTDKVYHINDDRLVLENLKKVPNFDNTASFFYLHLNSVHQFGKKVDRFKRYFPEKNLENPIEYTNKYDNDIITADNYIRRIFSVLEQKSYLQNSIVVITADHGENLGEIGLFGHGQHLYNYLLNVPILIYDSDTNNYKNLQTGTTLDIAPTIIDRLGLQIPEGWEGVSLYSGESRKYTYHQMDGRYAIIHRNGNHTEKYIFNLVSEKEELYNIDKDFYEKHNLINSLDTLNRSMYRKLIRKVFKEYHQFK